MSKIIEAWEALLREATSSDYDEQQNAVFKIALILERHNTPNKLPAELYEENLSRELMRLALDDKRQSETIHFLVEMIRSNDSTAEAFLYALRKAKLALIVEPLLDVIKAHGNKWALEARYEAVMGLKACLNAELPDLTAVIRAKDPSALLDEWAESDDEELGIEADRVLEKIEHLLGTISE